MQNSRVTGAGFTEEREFGFYLAELVCVSGTISLGLDGLMWFELGGEGMQQLHPKLLNLF